MILATEKEILVRNMYLNKIARFVKEKFNKIKYIKNIKFELLFFVTVLIALFFLLHFKVFFNVILMTIMLFCAFDSFEILQKVSESEDNKKYSLFKYGLFIYILLPFSIVSSLYFIAGTEKLFWFLSLIIFNKMLYYVIDNVMEPNVISYKIYGDRTIFSVLNSFIFAVFFGIIFSLLLKQNIIIFVLLNIFIALLFFAEEYFIFHFKKIHNLIDNNGKFINYLIGLFLPSVFVFILSFFKVI